MDSTAYIGLSRQVALMRDMTVLATNIANANTSGFKSQHILFETVLERAGEPRQLAFVQDRGTMRDMASGALEPTGNPLDLAVDGTGWLAFDTAEGTRYSRAGHLAINAAGTIVDPAGNPLLDGAGAPLNVAPGDHELTVAPDGTISGRSGIIGQVGLSEFADPQALTPTGGSMWQTDQPAERASGRLVQGMLEASNVQPVIEMTRLIETQRAFEGTQRLIDVDHELQRKAVDRLLAGGRA